MESASLAGSLLQTFSPTAVAIVYWVWYAPQQILVVLLGALGAILGVGLVGAFFAASNSTPGAAAGFTYLHLVVQECVRMLLSLLLAKVEGIFKSKGHSLTASKVGVAATGMAAGFGQGTMQAVLTMGLAASTSTAAQFEGVSGYDWVRCPYMPQLQYLSLVGLFTILVHVACSVVAILFVSSWVSSKRQAASTEGTPLTQDDGASAPTPGWSPNPDYFNGCGMGVASHIRLFAPCQRRVLLPARWGPIHWL